MKTHTPGPWVRHSLHRGVVVPLGHETRPVGGSIHEDENRNRFAFLIARKSTWRVVDTSEREANLDLIAAAPELLLLVERCFYSHDGGDCFDLAERDRWMEDARAVLQRLGSDVVEGGN